MHAWLSQKSTPVLIQGREFKAHAGHRDYQEGKKKKNRGKRKTISEKNGESVTKMSSLREILKDAFHEERK